MWPQGRNSHTVSEEPLCVYSQPNHIQLSLVLFICRTEALFREATYVPSLKFKTCFCVLRRKPCRSCYFSIVFALLSVAVAVSTHLCVICHHFCCPMSLFQGHVACQNFTPTGASSIIKYPILKSAINNFS